MEILKVKSSNIKQFEYDKEMLTITYYNKKNGTESKYVYFDVPGSIWEQIKAYKGSYGSFIRKAMKGFRYQKK